MLAFITAVTCLALLYGLLYLIEQRKQRRKIERRLHGLSALQTGLNLMTAVQQHRGLSAGLLNGNDSFRANLVNKQAETREVLARMQTLIDDDTRTRSRPSHPGNRDAQHGSHHCRTPDAYT
jgi:CHASE3 domain sensor protein